MSEKHVVYLEYTKKLDKCEGRVHYSFKECQRACFERNSRQMGVKYLVSDFEPIEVVVGEGKDT